jgi:Flp pilus assembly pilin Flp
MRGIATTLSRALPARPAGEQGASTVEYALMLLFIAVLALVAVAAFGQAVAGNLWNNASKIG